jgi:flagellar biosynthesis/type III secretory pathway M-ring protein FliF/YscJ
MMQQKTWCVVLSVVCVLVVFCAVRAVRRPAASEGAQRIEVSAGRAQANEAIIDLPLRQLETIREAQRTRQQETADELQCRQQEAPGLPSDNPAVSVDAAGG